MLVAMARRILIVDDSPVVLGAVKHALGEAGYAVETRSSVDELDVSSLDYDLVLMDVEMPELYGDDVAGILRDTRGITTPIVLFSSLPEAELRDRAREAGLRGYICKDAGLDHLVDEVRRLLGG
jgi:DNA-binding response OmpR family regulator